MSVCVECVCVHAPGTTSRGATPPRGPAIGEGALEPLVLAAGCALEEARRGQVRKRRRVLLAERHARHRRPRRPRCLTSAGGPSGPSGPNGPGSSSGGPGRPAGSHGVLLEVGVPHGPSAQRAHVPARGEEDLGGGADRPSRPKNECRPPRPSSSVHGHAAGGRSGWGPEWGQP